MSKEFSHFIKAIGAGKRAGRYLTEQEAFSAMQMLLNDEVLPEQKGAFLMLLRVREESVDELSGFVRACRSSFSYAKNNAGAEPSVDLDIGCYAGKRRQLPWFILALGVLQQNDYRLFIHGTSEPDSNRLYVKEALQQLGLLDGLQAKTPGIALSKISTEGVAYMDLQDFHAPLYNVIQLRSLFGLRSCANTLARLLNPMAATYSVQGVHHQGVDVKHIEIAARLGDANVLCFRGEGGEPEVNPSKTSEVHFYRHNKAKAISQVEIAEKQSWQIKPKSLDTSLLLQCWQSSDDNCDLYGVKTIISTLTPILMMTKSLPQHEAGILAKQLWQQRDKSVLLRKMCKKLNAGSETR